MLTALLSALIATASPPAISCPLVVAHRGASGERPEHTLEAYRLAVTQGADYIEPDLVMTRDKVLVARHENEISGTTDVADRPEFAGRKATKTIDAQSITGWFTEDFTLAELKSLRARERLPQLRGRAHDGLCAIPTFDEVLALLARLRTETRRPIGIAPEIKHSSYFTRIGLPMEQAVVAALAAAGFSRPADAAMIQSFEVGNLQALKAMTGVRLIQLVDDTGAPADRPAAAYATMLTPDGLKAIAAYAQAIAPAKSLLIPRRPDGSTGAPTRLAADAHAAGLAVIPWTFRRENAFLPLESRKGDAPAAIGDLAGEIRKVLDLGVDAVFSDNPNEAVAARSAWRPACAPPARTDQ